MARWSKLTASFTVIVGALISAGACSGSSEVNFDDMDAAAGGSSNAGSAGRGGSAGNDASAGTSGAGGSIGGSTGGAGAGGTAATAGMGGAAGRGGSSGAAGRGGTNGAAGSAGVSGSAGRGGTAGSAGTAGVSGTGGRGGTAGTAGTAGASGTAGSGGVPDGGACPTDIPAPGSNCAPEGLSCTYGECCPVYASCAQGHWQLSGPPCVPPVCPASLPLNGVECNPCQDASQCRYDRCGVDGVISIANCNTQTRRWQVLSASCSTPCGNQGMTCDADEVCVRTLAGPGPSFRCADDPCAPNAPSCQCAANLCQSPSTCSSVSNRVVTCSCLTCQ